jgi:hypothetical protein
MKEGKRRKVKGKSGKTFDHLADVTTNESADVGPTALGSTEKRE